MRNTLLFCKCKDGCTGCSLAAGLMGHNFLYLLEAAKKNVLQPGCAVVPCAASLYVMGINIQTQAVGGYDLSGLNKYRSVQTHPASTHQATAMPWYLTPGVQACMQACMHAFTHSFTRLFI